MTTFNPKCSLLYQNKPKAIPSFGIRIEVPFFHVCPDEEVIAPFSISKMPPCEFIKPEIDLSLREFKKEITSPLIFQSRFAELRDKYCDHNAIYTDGSKVCDRVAAAAISDHHQSKI